MVGLGLGLRYVSHHAKLASFPRAFVFDFTVAQVRLSTTVAGALFELAFVLEFARVEVGSPETVVKIVVLPLAVVLDLARTAVCLSPTVPATVRKFALVFYRTVVVVQPPILMEFAELPIALVLDLPVSVVLLPVPVAHVVLPIAFVLELPVPVVLLPAAVTRFPAQGALVPHAAVVVV